MKNLFCFALIIFFSFFPEERGNSQASTGSTKTAGSSPVFSPLQGKPLSAQEENPAVTAEKKKTDSINTVLNQQSADRDRQYATVVNILTATEAENKQLRKEIDDLKRNKAIPALSDHTEADYAPMGTILQNTQPSDSVGCVIQNPTTRPVKKNFFRRIASIFNKKRNGPAKPKPTD